MDLNRIRIPSAAQPDSEPNTCPSSPTGAPSRQRTESADSKMSFPNGIPPMPEMVRTTSQVLVSPYKRLSVDVSESIVQNATIMPPLTRFGEGTQSVKLEPSLDDIAKIDTEANPVRKLHRRSISDSCLIDSESYNALLGEGSPADQLEAQSSCCSLGSDEFDEEFQELEDEARDTTTHLMTAQGSQGSSGWKGKGKETGTGSGPRPFMRSKSMDVVSKTRIDIKESVAQKLVTVKTVVDTQMKTVINAAKHAQNVSAEDMEQFKKLEALVNEIAGQEAYNMRSALSNQYVRRLLELQNSGLSGLVSKCLVHFTRITRLVEFRDVGSNVTDDDAGVDMLQQHNFHTIHMSPRNAAAGRDRSFTHTSLLGGVEAPATLAGTKGMRGLAQGWEADVAAQKEKKSALQSTLYKFRERRTSKDSAEDGSGSKYDPIPVADHAFTAPPPRSALTDSLTAGSLKVSAPICIEPAADPAALAVTEDTKGTGAPAEASIKLQTLAAREDDDFKELQFDTESLFSPPASKPVSEASSFVERVNLPNLEDMPSLTSPQISFGTKTSDGEQEEEADELVCRICEEYVASEHLDEHSEHCVEANKSDMTAAAHDQKLYKYYEWVEKHIADITAQRQRPNPIQAPPSPEPAPASLSPIPQLPSRTTSDRSDVEAAPAASTTLASTLKKRNMKTPSPIQIPETPSTDGVAKLEENGGHVLSPPPTANLSRLVTISPTRLSMSKSQANSNPTPEVVTSGPRSFSEAEEYTLSAMMKREQLLPGNRLQGRAVSVRRRVASELKSRPMEMYSTANYSTTPPNSTMFNMFGVSGSTGRRSTAPSASVLPSSKPLSFMAMPQTARYSRERLSDLGGVISKELPTPLFLKRSMSRDTSPRASFDFKNQIPLRRPHSNSDESSQHRDTMAVDEILRNASTILSCALQGANHNTDDNEQREKQLKDTISLADEMKELALQAEKMRADKSVIQALQRIVREMQDKVIAMRNARESRLKRDANRGTKRRSLASQVSEENVPSIPHTQTSAIPTIEDFEYIKPIKKGAFGSVYLCRKRTTGDLYAIKMLKKSDLLRKNKARYVRAERDILASVNNPFVVRMYYAFQNDEKLFFVMEFLNGGDCYSLLRHLGYLDEEMAKVYIAETVLALEYLHSQEIIHRDVKPDNMLISAEGHIKLTDFGLSHFGNVKRNEEFDPVNMASGSSSAGALGGNENLSPVQEAGQSPLKTPRSQRGDKTPRGPVGQQGVVGTPDYLAPEILYGSGHGYEVDWWALGVILYEFLTGYPPFSGDTPEEVFENILAYRLEWPSIPEEMSHEAKSIIERLLDQNPQTRLGHNGAAEIKAHPFFSSIDWANLFTHESPFIPFIPQLDNETDTEYFVGGEVHHGINSGQASFASSIGDMDEIAPDPNQMAFSGFSYKNVGNLEAINRQKATRRNSVARSTSPYEGSSMMQEQMEHLDLEDVSDDDTLSQEDDSFIIHS